jgi:hypothetical protein
MADGTANFVSRVRGCLSRTPGRKWDGLVREYELPVGEVTRRVGEITLGRPPDATDLLALKRWEEWVMSLG